MVTPAPTREPTQPAAAPAAAAAQPGAPAAAPGTPPKAPAAAPGAPAPRPAARTALEPDPAPDPNAAPAPQPSAGAWPEDWREQIAGNDEKYLKALGRYASVKDVANALVAAQNRIRSGELLPALKPNATAEELAAWRTEAGIPLKAEEYAMPDGIVFGEDDKPFIASFLKAAHGAHYRPEQVKAALAWYHADREAQIEALANADNEHLMETTEAIGAHWGKDAARNKAMINGLIATAPKEVADQLLGARGPDDRSIMNSFPVLEWLHSLAFKINPVATVVPGATGDIGASIDEEIAKFEKMMGDHRSEYWKGPNAEKNQARLRELYEARDRYKQGAK